MPGAPYKSFWENAQYNGKGLQEYYSDMVKHVVSKFQYLQGNIVGYEIMNEPYYGLTNDCPSGSPTPCLCEIVKLTIPPVLQACPSFDNALGFFYGKVISAIRKIDNETNILYEPSVWFDDGGFSNPKITVADNQLIFSFHNYNIFSTQAFNDVFTLAERVHQNNHI